jgi:hypothetical protein
MQRNFIRESFQIVDQGQESGRLPKWRAASNVSASRAEALRIGRGAVGLTSFPRRLLSRINFSSADSKSRVEDTKSADSMIASKSLARRLARLIQPNVRSTIQRLGNTMKPLICLSLRWTTVMEMRLVSNAARCASSPSGNQKVGHFR